MKMQTKVNRNGPRLGVALVEADEAWQDRLSSFFSARPDCVWLGAGATSRQLAKRVAGDMPGALTFAPAMPTALSGTKMEVDGNECADPPTRSVTEVEVIPNVTWRLYEYPPGTTPTSGNGTTATFTVIHGGYVWVEFNADASVANPAWQQHVRCLHNRFRVFEVVDLAPDQGCEVYDGDQNPNTKTFLVYQGTGVVTVIATPAPGVASEDELPDCWQLTGGYGTSRLFRTVNKNQTGETTVQCTAGTSYKTTKIIVFYFNGMDYKWENDPGFLPTDGCGRIHYLGTYCFRANIVPATVPLQWEYWETDGLDTLLASGSGKEFCQGMNYQGTIMVRFFADNNGNLLYDSGECALSHEFDVRGRTTHHVTRSRHAEVNYGISEFSSHLWGASHIALRRDRWMASGGDVHCRTTLFRADHPDGDTYKMFGTTGDGLNNVYYLDGVPGSGNAPQVFAKPGTFKAVETIRRYYSDGTWIDIPGVESNGSIIIQASALDVVYIHEYRHAKGRSGHTTVNSSYIMYPERASPMDSLYTWESNLLE